MSDIIRETVNVLGQWLGPVLSIIPSSKEVETVVIREVEAMSPIHGQVFVRLAGLSGAVAVIMGAYGAHSFRDSEADPKLKLTYETGNRYHFFHTLALLAIPLTRRPVLVGSLMLTGTLLFSGSCYYHALTGNTTIRKITPYGGMTLIAAWLAVML